MAQCSVQNIFDDVRSLLHDTQVAGGELYTNNYLLTGYQSGGVVGSGSLFGEPYRTMFGKLAGGSKRVQPNAYIVLPSNTTVIIPSTYNITDFAEPEMIEERPATAGITISSTDTSTPIKVTAPSHGLTGQVEGTVSGVAGTAAPWGNWFATVIDGNTFSLNGSASDGVAGTGGAFYPSNTEPFTEVIPTRFASGLDGPPQGVLGNYLWSNGRLQFRGAVGPVQLRITYYASGSAPTNPNYTIWIDNCRDFLAHATAANAARSQGWDNVYQELRNKAYGDPTHPDEASLLDLFYMSQVLASQNDSSRQQPFRSHRYKFGSYLLG